MFEHLNDLKFYKGSSRSHNSKHCGTPNYDPNAPERQHITFLTIPMLTVDDGSSFNFTATINNLPASSKEGKACSTSEKGQNN